jgi:hypothetical protein
VKGGSQEKKDKWWMDGWGGADGNRLGEALRSRHTGHRARGREGTTQAQGYMHTRIPIRAYTIYGHSGNDLDRSIGYLFDDCKRERSMTLG